MRIPPKPYLILPCNFVTTSNADEVVSSLKELFNNGFASVINYEYIDQDTTVDYEYVDHECGFNGVSHAHARDQRRGGPSISSIFKNR